MALTSTETFRAAGDQGRSCSACDGPILSGESYFYQGREVMHTECPGSDTVQRAKDAVFSLLETGKGTRQGIRDVLTSVSSDARRVADLTPVQAVVFLRRLETLYSSVRPGGTVHTSLENYLTACRVDLENDQDSSHALRAVHGALLDALEVVAKGTAGATCYDAVSLPRFRAAVCEALGVTEDA